MPAEKRDWYYLDSEYEPLVDSSNIQIINSADIVIRMTRNFVNLTKDKYRLIPPSDTTVQVKVKGRKQKMTGFRLQDIDYTVNIPGYKGKRYRAPYFNMDHKIQVGVVKQKKFFAYSDLKKVKFKKKKKMLKVKIRKRDLYPKKKK